MKQISIKALVTIWYAIFMVLIVGIVFGMSSVIGGVVGKNDTKSALMELVRYNSDKMLYENGQLEALDSFIYLQNGIFCVITTEQGNILAGTLPTEMARDTPTVESMIRTIAISGITYYVYDREITFSRDVHIWLRAFTPTANRTVPITTGIKSMLLVLPLLVGVALVGGYLVTKTAFKRIDSITNAANAISEGSDLSQRIEMGKGNDEVQRLAQTYNRMFARLEASFEQEKRFTADVSHELRTPIAIISAQCEYSLQYASRAEEFREALEIVQQQSRRMGGIVTQMLAFAKLERGAQSMRLETLNLSELVRTLCQERMLSNAKNIQMHIEVEDDIVVVADLMLIGRVVSNLLNNAYQYGKDNGNTKVSLYRLQRKAILIVNDDGIGMAQKDIPKIWNRFYQADKSRSLNMDGATGLGLSMVQQIVKMHKGTVRVDSALGKGSTFIVCIPLAQ